MANQPAPAPPENTPGSSDGDHDDDVDVVCWVCMGMYTDPVSLSCGHTVCLKCARETLVAAAKLASSRPCGLGTSPSASPPSASSCSLPGQTNSAASATSLNREYRIDASETVEVTCPFQCTKTTTIKTNTTGGGLKPNTVVNELVENRKTELLRATLCEAPYCCVEPACSPSPATCKCSWCHDLLFCGPCFKQHHQRGAFKLHKATEISPNVTYSCRIHGGKERDLLCSCGISICYLCEKSEKHSGHTSRPLTDSLPKKITEVQGFIQQLSGISNEEATAITQMNTEKLSITKAISSGSISILDDLQAIQCTLEGRCKEINLIAQSLSDSMGHNLDAQNNSLEVVLKSHQGLISKANEVVQQRNPMDVLKAHSILSSLLSAKVLLDKHRLEPCEQAKAIRCMTGPRDELIGMIKKYGTVNKGRLPNPPSGGRAPVCTRKSDTIITVQWEPPSPHDEQMDIEQVVGYSVLVSPSSNHTASASLPETTTSPPSSLSPSTLKTTGGGARDGVRGPLEAVATVALFEVKGKETTKCEVTVEPKELAVSVCAVSLVGSSAPTQSATVATTPPREVEVFVWGAAGGANGGNCMAGGPGGFSTARMVLKTGTRLTIVGEGAAAP
ncbi:hypothetical protein Pelo_14526 [Pelomyxa schiedti]|nr:hypothetical protein Pelo_14526 [Pelomyxa schiedti]